MHTITLPDELSYNPILSIEIYNYQSVKEISKQQILLNKNTFSFLQEGTKEVFFNNSTHEISNSKFLLMKSGNCLMTEKLSSLKENYSSVLLFFTNEDVFEFIKKYNLKKSTNNTYYSMYSFNYDAFIKRFVHSLLDVFKLSKEIQAKILKVKFEEIMLYLFEFKGSDFIYSLIDNNNNEVHKFKQTIESNKLNKLSIKELSFLSNMSVSKFKREFEKHFKSSPSKWFQEKRLDHAAYLLKNNSKRPSDIYEEIGYESLSNFIQAFKHKFGLTPKQYQSN